MLPSQPLAPAREFQASVCVQYQAFKKLIVIVPVLELENCFFYSLKTHELDMHSPPATRK